MGSSPTFSPRDVVALALRPAVGKKSEIANYHLFETVGELPTMPPRASPRVCTGQETVRHGDPRLNKFFYLRLVLLDLGIFVGS